MYIINIVFYSKKEDFIYRNIYVGKDFLPMVDLRSVVTTNLIVKLVFLIVSPYDWRYFVLLTLREEDCLKLYFSKQTAGAVSIGFWEYYI